MCAAAVSLAPVRHKVATCGDNVLPPLLAVVTDAGTASKEQGNFIIKEAVSTLMSFWGAPFRCEAACSVEFSALVH
jgi:hypothetical protein